MTDRIGVTVVGAGVVGAAVARELSRAGDEVVVLEKNPGVARGENQSSRNSGVIHAGLYYDKETRPLKADLCVTGNELLYQFCEKHSVPAKKTGKLVVAVEESRQPVLKEYLERARRNGVPARLVEAGEIREMEPGVRATAGLLLPTSGVVDAAALVHALYARASGSGAQFVTETEVVGMAPGPEGIEVRVRYRDGAEDVFLTEKLVNCAGLYCDDVARMANPASSCRVDPLRGESMKFYQTKRPELRLRGMNVYPTPQQVKTDQGVYFTVGVHLTPTLVADARGNVSIGPEVTVGPLNRQARGKEAYGGPYRPRPEFFRPVAPFFPGLREDDLEPHQAGVQARLVDHQD
ncbi:MAG: FAD-dependent oxidoreductase, partial [Desulfobacterales bacterium]|nr:FAD-dependent oxidoreductase [Desulfobacterales bacterium]